MLTFTSPIFRSKGSVVTRPSLIEKRIFRSRASMRRSLSFFSRSASLSKTSTPSTLTFSELISPCAVSDMRSGDIAASSVVRMSIESE